MNRFKEKMDRRQFAEFANNFFTEDNKPFVSCLYRVFRDENGYIIAIKPLSLNVERNYGFTAVVLDMFGMTADELKARDSCVYHTFDADGITKMLEYYFASFLSNNLAEHINIQKIISAKVKKREIGAIVCPNKEVLKRRSLSLEEIHFKNILICNEIIDPNTVNYENFDPELLSKQAFFEDIAMSQYQWEQKNPFDNGPTAVVDYFPLPEWYKL